MIEEGFLVPPLFILMSMGLGVAVFFAPHTWVLSFLRSKQNSEIMLGQHTFSMAMSVFFTVALFSVIRVRYGGEGSYALEAFVLFALYGGAHIQAYFQGIEQKKIPVRIASAWFSRNLKVMLFSLAGFIVIQVFVLLFAFVNMQSGQILLNPVREATFVSGVFWIGLLFLMFERASRKGVIPEGVKFHNVLWPLVVGLFLMMLPLLVQEIATSEKFREMMEAPARLHKV